MATEGDRVLDRPIPELGGKGVFTAELETALRAGTIDAAVHSLKDLPTYSDASLTVLAVPFREDARDVLVYREEAGLDDLPRGSVVGTSSLRRRAQLLRLRPDCAVEPIRGNVETRLRKWREGRYDALLLAAAGLRRLGGLPPEATPLSPEEWIPAPAQGALGVQARDEPGGVRTLLEAIDDPEARTQVTAERAFLARLEGSCRVPVGALATLEGEGFLLRGIVLSPDGRNTAAGTRGGAAHDAAKVGRELAEELLAAGADRILAPLRQASASPRSGG